MGERKFACRPWLRWLPILVFVLVPVILHQREIRTGEAYFFSDRIYLMAHYFDVYNSATPWQTYQWSDKVHFGFSYLRESPFPVFHFPENLAMLLLSPFAAILACTLFWLFVGQYCAFRYLRLLGVSRLAATIGAVMACFSGLTTHGYVHYEEILSIAMTPVLFWVAERLIRGFSVGLALVAALLIANHLSGPHPQMPIYLLVAICLYSLIRAISTHGLARGGKIFAGFGAAFLLGVMLCAVWILPWADQISAAKVSDRKTAGNLSMLGAMPSRDRVFVLLHALFAPGAVGSDMPHANRPTLARNSWEWTVYIGVLPWFALGCVPRVWRRRGVMPLLVIAGACTWSFVPELFCPVLPSFATIYGAIPVLSKFHIIERCLFLGVFSAGMVLSLALDSWSKRPTRAVMSGGAALGVLLLGVSATVSVWGVWPGALPSPLAEFISMINRSSSGVYAANVALGAQMSVMVALSLILFVGRYVGLLPRGRFLGLALVVVIADLLWYGMPPKPTLPAAELLAQRPPLVASVPAGDTVLALLRRQQWATNRDIGPAESLRSLGPLFNIFCGVRAVGGWLMPVLPGADYDVLRGLGAEVGMPVPHVRSAGDIHDIRDILRRLSVGCVVTDVPLTDPAFPLLARDGDYALHRVAGALPWLRDATALRILPATTDPLDAMANDPAGDRVAYQISDGSGSVTIPCDPLSIGRVVASVPLAIDVEVEAGGRGGLLVIARRWTKEWQGRVDGMLTPILRINGMHCGVAVPPGNHTVSLRYVDWHCQAGAFLSVLAVALGMLWWRSGRGEMKPQGR